MSSDFHVRFDNAYYSIDKAYLHKEVFIRATSVSVKFYSKEGQFLCEWPRAKHKGQWSTDPAHLPANYKEMAEWNSTYFIKKAMTVGPNTVEVIKKILQSRQIEVQTYRWCIGILSFTKKYSRQALEECCSRALQLNRTTYSFIKNSIAAVADEMGTAGLNLKQNEERNKGGYVMGTKAMDVDTLLTRSRDLASRSGKEAES